MPRASKPKIDLLDVAFQAIAEHGWRGFSVTGLAAATGLSYAELYDELPSKAGVLHLLGKRLDHRMLAIAPDDLTGLSVRERLFELFMRRFDAMRPFKSGLRELAQGGRCDGALICVAFCNLDRMADRMLDLAGAGLGGLRAKLARRCLMTAHLRVFRIWLQDDSEDQAATLAALDTDLAKLERLAKFGARSFRRSPKGSGEDSAQAA